MMKLETLVKTCDAFGMVRSHSSPLAEWLVKRDLFLCGVDTSHFSGPSPFSAWLAARA